MKPIVSRTFFTQNFLISLAIMLAVMGTIFSTKTITIVHSSFGTIVEGEAQIPLYLGIVPLPFLTNFLGFIFIYLIFEFYGFKPAFYTALNQAAASLMCLVVLYVIKHFTLDIETSKYDEILFELFVYKKSSLLALIFSFMAGNAITVFLASILKKLMRNYFMFLRFPLSAIPGFAVCVALYTYLNGFETLATRTLLVYGITPAIQFLALIIAAIIPLYLLRLLLGIFRGWSNSEDVLPPASKSLFKAEDMKIIPELPLETPSDTILSSPPDESVKKA